MLWLSVLTGHFWISFACIFIPFFDVAGAYTNPDELFAALGHYLICIVPRNLAKFLILGWVIFTVFLTVGHFALLCLFRSILHPYNGFHYVGNRLLQRRGKNCLKAGGWFGLITALFAWYNAIAALWNPGNSFIKLPVGQFPWAEKGRPHVGRKPRRV